MEKVLKADVIEFEIPLWVDKWNTEDLKKHLERVGPTAFNRGLRNISLSNSDRTFPSFEKCLHNNTVSNILKGKQYVAFSGVDLSTKKRKGTCIFTLAKLGKNYVPLDIRAGKWTGPKLLDNIIAVNKLFKPKSFLVENNALQDMVIDFLKEYSKSHTKNFKRPFIKGHFTGSNKLDEEHGLESLEVDFYNERWIIPFKDGEHKLSCKCGLCRWKDEIIGHPLFETTDVLMASWLARENARKSSIGNIRLL